MKTIGLIGGMAWPSSMLYYRKINEMVAVRLGGMHCAKLMLVQTDFEIIERLQRESNWDRLGEILVGLGNALKHGGADLFLIACNTMHIAAGDIESRVGLPFIHIVDPTGDRLKRLGVSTVGLLGSRYTMQSDFFKKRLKERFGMNTIIAEGIHKDNVHTALYQELAKGIVTDATRIKFKDAVAEMAARGAEAIILGCTEFGLAVKGEDCPVPLVDTLVMHAGAAVEAALAE